MDVIVQSTDEGYIAGKTSSINRLSVQIESRLSVNETNQPTNLHKLRTSADSTDNATLDHAYHLIHKRVCGVGVMVSVEDNTRPNAMRSAGGRY